MAILWRVNYRNLKMFPNIILKFIYLLREKKRLKIIEINILFLIYLKNLFTLTRAKSDKWKV